MVPKTMSETFQQAIYQLAYCYLMNKEYLRCVELLEKYDLVYQTLKFRLLTAQALFNSNNTQACIKVLEKEPTPEEIAHSNSL